MTGNASANAPVQVLLAGRTASLIRLTCKSGLRPALLDVLNNYLDRLGEEPGTEIFTLSIDPDNEDLVWMYEVFASEDAQREHMQSPAVADMLPPMQELLDGPPAVLRMMPLRLSLQETVLSDEFEV
jgi:quinol monooxygenase YgiN